MAFISIKKEETFKFRTVNILISSSVHVTSTSTGEFSCIDLLSIRQDYGFVRDKVVAVLF